MITVSVKGEPLFGFPRNLEKVELGEPTFNSIMEHYNVDPKIRKHLLAIVNNKVSKPERMLENGDEINFQSPYSGG